MRGPGVVVARPGDLVEPGQRLAIGGLPRLNEPIPLILLEGSGARQFAAEPDETGTRSDPVGVAFTYSDSHHYRTPAR